MRGVLTQEQLPPLKNRGSPSDPAEEKPGAGRASKPPARGAGRAGRARGDGERSVLLLSPWQPALPRCAEHGSNPSPGPSPPAAFPRLLIPSASRCPALTALASAPALSKAIFHQEPLRTGQERQKRQRGLRAGSSQCQLGGAGDTQGQGMCG